MYNTGSVQLYAALYEKRNDRLEKIRREEILAVFAHMEKELFILGHSPLLSKAFEVWSLYARKKRLSQLDVDTEYYMLRPADRRLPVTVFDAYVLLVYMVDFVDRSTIVRTAEELADNMFDSQVLPENPDTTFLAEQMDKLDKRIGAMRAQWFEGERGKATRESVDFATRLRASVEADLNECVRERERQIESTYENARRDADIIMARAAEKGRLEAEKMRNEILREARAEAEMIRSKAESAAEERLARARKRATEIINEARSGIFKEEKELFSDSFDALRKALMNVNEKMREVEDGVNQASTKKALRLLTELYNIIGDVYDSQAQRYAKEKTPEAENNLYNLEMFMDIICEALAEYGIKTILTEPGKDFDAKYHAAVNTNAFNPRNAKVEKSVRCGFVWGESVVQKERVKIVREAE